MRDKTTQARQALVNEQHELVHAGQRTAAAQILRAMAEAIEAGEGTAEYYPSEGELLVQTESGIGRLVIDHSMICALAENGLQLAPEPVPLQPEVRLQFQTLQRLANQLLDRLDGIRDLSNQTSQYLILRELIRGDRNAVAPDLRSGIFPALCAYSETFALAQEVIDQVFSAAGRAQSNLQMAIECMQSPRWREDFQIGTRHRLAEAVAAYKEALRLVQSKPLKRLPQIWWELPAEEKEEAA